MIQEFSSAENTPDALQNSDRQQSTRILLAEDNPGDAYLIREAMALADLSAEITHHMNGEQVMQCVDRIANGEKAAPDLIVLDLNMPCFGGEEILKRIRASAKLSQIPVLIITSSQPAAERIAADIGAVHCFIKPNDLDEYYKIGAVVKQLAAAPRK